MFAATQELAKRAIFHVLDRTVIGNATKQICFGQFMIVGQSTFDSDFRRDSATTYSIRPFLSHFAAGDIESLFCANNIKVPFPNLSAATQFPLEMDHLQSAEKDRASFASLQ